MERERRRGHRQGWMKGGGQEFGCNVAPVSPFSTKFIKKPSTFMDLGPSLVTQPFDEGVILGL